MKSFSAGLALDQAEGDVAAENDAAFTRQPVLQASRHRADAGDGHDAERDAGDEHVEAAQPASHLAQGEAQRQQHAYLSRLRGRSDRGTVRVGN
jgi:hypothetical protein